MAIRKYLISYTKKGVEAKEVPPDNLKPAQPTKKPKLTLVKTKDTERVKSAAPEASMVPNLNAGGRTEEIVKICQDKGITDRIIIEQMIREAYAGTKKEKYILDRIQFAIQKIYEAQ